MQSNEANYDHMNGESDPKHRAVYRACTACLPHGSQTESFPEETVQLGTELSAELYKYMLTIDDLRKSRGLHSVRAFGHGPVYIGPGLRV